jgi:hypothetical protein
MDFKIFKVKGKPDVLVYRAIDENNKYEVRLQTFFIDPEDKTNEDFHEEVITFESDGSQPSQRFIKDLSQEGVEEFLSRFSF